MASASENYSANRVSVSDNSEGIKEVFEMFISMLIASYGMLGEHDLLKPDLVIPNVGIITLLMLDFLEHGAKDFDLDGYHELVRAADKAGIVLEPRKELNMTEEQLEDLRETHRQEDEEEAERKREFDWEVDVSLSLRITISHLTGISS